MALDAYGPCPCGSGKKFKWCCQPIHVEISKAFEQEAGGQHEVALALMEKVCAEHSGNPEAWGRKAQLLYQVGRAEDAEAALQKAFDINPDYPFGLYLRGRFRHMEGEIPGAVLLFRRALEVYDPSARDVRSHIWSLLADCELKLNRPVAARAALEMAIKEEPTNPDTKAGLEQAFGKESKLPESAKREYQYQNLAADASPERRTAWQTALQTASTGKLSDAAKAFEQLTTTDAQDAGAWFNLGLTKAWLGDNAAALAAFERSVQLDQDEQRAARTWTLAEVMMCGHGMENQATFVEHSLTFPIRNPDMLVRLLQELQRQGRLIGVQAVEEQGILTGVLVELAQTLTVMPSPNQLAHLAAYMIVIGGVFRIWNVNRERLDAAARELRQLDTGALGQPAERTGPARFDDVLAEAWAFPVHATDETMGKQLMLGAFERHWEESWIHKPLKPLNGIPPVDAAGLAMLRRKLLGHIQFLAECAAVAGTQYDFDRLRRKLGLLGATPTMATQAGPDISAMGAPELAALDGEKLSDDQLEAAYQSALKLAAQDLASKFAKLLIARPAGAERPDRFSVFSYLVQSALAEGNNDAALDYVNEGEKTDCEHNEGRRRNDYELRRGQVLVKRGEIAQAVETFDRLIERAPDELRFRGTAAESMLSAKQSPHALRFAEGGLKKSREQNNRDSEQYFMELVAAGKKVSG